MKAYEERTWATRLSQADGYVVVNVPDSHYEVKAKHFNDLCNDLVAGIKEFTFLEALNGEQVLLRLSEIESVIYKQAENVAGDYEAIAQDAVTGD